MIKLKAPAKINWSLYVMDKREDGYHNIISLMQCVGLYDTLTFEHSSSIELNSDMRVSMRDNLVFRAAVALQHATGTNKGAAISLIKKIPSGAGLGGGSSDAAAALKGLNELWELGLDNKQLAEIGLSLGSDVPFFFISSAAIATGRGEILFPERISASRSLLLVKPEASIPTAWAYQAVAGTRTSDKTISDLTNRTEKLNNIKPIVRTLSDGPVSLLGPLLQNDFERVAIERHPVIGAIKARMLGTGALAAMLSGSGSALFGLFASRDDALKASDSFSSYWHRVVDTL
jgi:4-diphosphocytidyl-2-C-methyl-D-erythritol kinase